MEEYMVFCLKDIYVWKTDDNNGVYWLVYKFD